MSEVEVNSSEAVASVDLSSADSAAGIKNRIIDQPFTAETMCTPRRSIITNQVKASLLNQEVKRRKAVMDVNKLDGVATELFGNKKEVKRLELSLRKKVQVSTYKGERRVTLREYQADKLTPFRSISLTKEQYTEFRRKLPEILDEIKNVKSDSSKSGLIHIGNRRFIEVYWFQNSIRKFYRHKSIIILCVTGIRCLSSPRQSIINS